MSILVACGVLGAIPLQANIDAMNEMMKSMTCELNEKKLIILSKLYNCGNTCRKVCNGS